MLAFTYGPKMTEKKAAMAELPHIMDILITDVKGDRYEVEIHQLKTRDKKALVQGIKETFLSLDAAPRSVEVIDIRPLDNSMN